MTDTVTDYEAEEQKLRDAKQVIAGSTPLMENPPDSKVVLARGLCVNGTWETDVYIRELNGQDEENLARYAKDVITFLDAVLVYGIESIGSIYLADKDFDNRQGLLRQLLVGEREQLFMAVARVTFGDVKTLTFTCGSCDEAGDVDISISKDVKIPVMKNPHQMTYTFVTNKQHTIEYSLVTGWDQHEATSRKGISLAEENTVMIANVITAVDNQPVVDPTAFARNLSMGDRRKFIKELIEHQPNPDTALKVECSNCEAAIDLNLTWELIFRP